MGRKACRLTKLTPRSPVPARHSTPAFGARCCLSTPDVSQPFGGYKQSRWGYEYGLEGLNAYLKTKAVYVGI